MAAGGGREHQVINACICGGGVEPTKELIRVCVAEGGGVEDEGNVCVWGGEQ